MSSQTALICSGGRVVLPVDGGLLFARSSVVLSLRALVSRIGHLIISFGHRSPRAAQASRPGAG